MKTKQTQRASTYPLNGGFLHVDRQIIPIEINPEVRSEVWAWAIVARKAGLYRADEDVSTPDKWLSAQLKAYERLKIPPFNENQT